MTAEASLAVTRPQAAQVPRAIKTDDGYTRRMTFRSRVQTLWVVCCVMSGAVAQFLIAPPH